MSIVRVIFYGEEIWHRDVVNVTSERGYLSLTLASHPSRVRYWLPGGHVSVLIAETSSDVTAMLREEAGCCGDNCMTRRDVDEAAQRTEDLLDSVWRNS